MIEKIELGKWIWCNDDTVLKKIGNKKYEAICFADQENDMYSIWKVFINLTNRTSKECMDVAYLAGVENEMEAEPMKSENFTDEWWAKEFAENGCSDDVIDTPYGTVDNLYQLIPVNESKAKEWCASFGLKVF